MKKINIFMLLIIILSCSNSNIEDNNIQITSDYVVKSDIILNKKDIRNKFTYPCRKINTNLPENIKQLPGSSYYFFNETIEKTSLTLKCEEESIIYPIATGVVTDIQKDSYNVFKENEIFQFYFDRMIREVGHLPDDLKKILYKNYVIVDHGFYFTEGVRVLSVYTNLKDIPSDLKLGDEVGLDSTLGLINNNGMDVLSLTLLNDDNGELKAQEDIVNLEIYFQKGRNKSYLGEGVNYNNNPLYFDELFK